MPEPSDLEISGRGFAGRAKGDAAIKALERSYRYRLFVKAMWVMMVPMFALVESKLGGIELLVAALKAVRALLHL